MSASKEDIQARIDELRRQLPTASKSDKKELRLLIERLERELASK